MVSTAPSGHAVEREPGGERAAGDRPAYEATYAQLRRELLADVIPPGMRMREVELAERLQVSRTPVREALRRLESDGFVRRGASGGLEATPTGPDDLGDIGLLRIEIDGLAARLAATRGQAEDWDNALFLVAQLRTAGDEVEMAHLHRLLHREIYAVAFSPRMAAFFNSQLLPYVEEAVNVGPGHDSDPEGSFHQHLALLRDLASGDVDRAVHAAREHAAAGVRFAKSRSEIAGPLAAAPAAHSPMSPSPLAP